MRHLVIGQRQKAPNFSAFHWSPHGCLITIGQHFVTTRVVHLPRRTETSSITESDQSRANHQLLQLCRSARPGPIRTMLCGACIAEKAGLCFVGGHLTINILLAAAADHRFHDVFFMPTRFIRINNIFEIRSERAFNGQNNVYNYNQRDNKGLHASPI